MEPEAPDRPGIGMAGKFFLMVLGTLIVVVLAWMVVGWVLGWIFGALRIALFIGIVVVAGWLFLRLRSRDD